MSNLSYRRCRMAGGAMVVSVCFGALCISYAEPNGEPGRSGESLAEEESDSLGALPNGIVTVPANDLTEISMFSFRNAEMRQNPLAAHKNKTMSSEMISETLRNNAQGDILYDDAEGGMIVICSERVQDLGQGLLRDLRYPISPDFKNTRLVPAVPGSRYMVRTINGKRAVVRVLTAGREGVRLQWLYQPNNAGVFVLPNKLNSDSVFRDIRLSYKTMAEAADGLRRNGLRVCLEQAENAKTLEFAKTLAFREVVVRDILDEVVGVFGEYRWKIMDNTDIILIFPVARTVFSGRAFPVATNSLTFASNSWGGVVSLLNLDARGIQFPPSQRKKKGTGVTFISGAIYEPPRDKVVSADFDHKLTLREALAVMCWIYGEGMYYEVRSPTDGDSLKLYFRKR